MKPPVLVITGYGVNCEAESVEAWRLAGAAPEMVHLNDLLDRPADLDRYAGLMFIGGFSYGDHMTSGHVFALRVKHHLQARLQRFVEDGKIILGVCNGFQIMTKIGLLPGLDGEYFEQKVALMENDCGSFQNFWVEVGFEPSSPCIFTRGLDRMPLPIRHGEGKFFTTDPRVLEQLESGGGVACRYLDPVSGHPASEFPHNPNGSIHAIAGICDPSGRVFGMMPHPEAYLFPENHPQWTHQRLAGSLPDEGLGLRLFRNAAAFMQASGAVNSQPVPTA